KPKRARHVGMDFPEQVRGRIITDKLQRLLEGLQGRFIFTFKQLGEGDPEVSFGQSAPVSGAAIMIESALRVVAGDRVFVDAAIDTRQRKIDRSEMWRGVTLRSFPQCGVQNSDRFGRIARVVVRKTNVNTNIRDKFGIQIL